MQLFCPGCQTAFAGTQRCPRCGGLLLMPQEVADAAPPLSKVPQAPPPVPTPGGRIVVGSLFSLGLYLGLREVATGVTLVAHPNAGAWWTSFEGLLAVCGGQALAVVFGAVVAAAGRVGGFGYGAAVGGLCGVLFLGAEFLAGAPNRDLVLYVQPVVLLMVGGVSGVLATRVWGAVPALDMPMTGSGPLDSSRFLAGAGSTPTRPTSVLRVLLGAAVIVLAVTAADRARTQAQRYSQGMLRVDTVGQGRFLTCQLAALGVLAGGALAGATTGAGVRHGALAGVLGAAGVFGVTAGAGEPPVAVSYWLSTLSLGGLSPNDPTVFVAAASAVILCGLIGGWLGGALFLPLAPEHMRRRLRSGLE